MRRSTAPYTCTPNRTHVRTYTHTHTHGAYSFAKGCSWKVGPLVKFIASSTELCSASRATGSPAFLAQPYACIRPRGATPRESGSCPTLSSWFLAEHFRIVCVCTVRHFVRAMKSRVCTMWMLKRVMCDFFPPRLRPYVEILKGLHIHTYSVWCRFTFIGTNFDKIGALLGPIFFVFLFQCFSNCLNKFRDICTIEDQFAFYQKHVVYCV